MALAKLTGASRSAPEPPRTCATACAGGPRLELRILSGQAKQLGITPQSGATWDAI
ncbi:MAG: hypothetical protein OXF60_07290 [Gammaproteobacteria bacterium]|nr:hypothetical protein [Gammaproteobacteria bacterium]